MLLNIISQPNICFGQVPRLEGIRLALNGIINLMAFGVVQTVSEVCRIASIRKHAQNQLSFSIWRNSASMSSIGYKLRIELLGQCQANSEKNVNSAAD